MIKNLPNEECDNKVVAVSVRNASKKYGWRNNVHRVFDDFNMTIQKGTIYGLLGPSGCGKTTILNCIVGVQKLDSGTVWVLGGAPNATHKGALIRKIGFLPQTIGLAEEFSIIDCLYYFGRIYNMSEENISERSSYLSELLELPPNDRLIKHCSGGEQRRVSLACTLIHEPEILILDEPTAGLDPLINDKIWKHFHDLSKGKNVTILITTHYIEETKQADYIGLMRDGALLCENTPQYLLKQFAVETLEDVFLTLSVQQESQMMTDLHKITYNEADICNNIMSTNIKEDVESVENCETGRSFAKWRRLKALLIKNTYQMLRNKEELLFRIITPTLISIFLLSGVGYDPIAKMGIVNAETSYMDCDNFTRENNIELVKYSPDSNKCHTQYLSCYFINVMQNDDFILKQFDDVQNAERAIRKGDIVGYLYFSINFTDALNARQVDGRTVKQMTIDNSEINISLDLSSFFTEIITERNLYDVFFKFMKMVKHDCHENDRRFTIPMNIELFHGTLREPFTRLINPPGMIFLVFFIISSLTCCTIFMERSEGIWYRSLIAGVTHGEILLSHFILQFFLTVVLIIQILVINIVFYDNYSQGELWLAFVMMLLQGIIAMLIGFIASTIFNTALEAQLVVIGLHLTFTFLCGLFWPWQALPLLFKHVSVWLPATMPMRAMSAIYNRGWSIDNLEVSSGIFISVAWIVVCTVVCYKCLKMKT